LKKYINYYIVMLFIVLIGFTMRMVVASRGYNYDMESWMIAADIMKEGGNVYAETFRYTSGPVWFNILHYIEKITNPTFPEILSRVSNPISEGISNFRYFITMFLTLVDLGMFFLLLRIYGYRIAVFFFLNPIAIMLTGYHSQFDNLALLTGLFSMLVFGESTDSKIGCRKILALVLLGLSIMIKHIFIFFPFWLAVKQKGLSRKFVILIVPLSVFFLGFAPYWEGAQNDIINNVFLYKGWEEAPFWRIFVPEVFTTLIPKRFFFFTTMIILAFIFRKYSVWKSMMIYTVSIVIFSSGIGNQYYAIVMPFISIYLNWAFLIFTFIGTYHLLTAWDSLHFLVLRNITPKYFLPGYTYFYLTLFLFIGLIWVLHKDTIVQKGKPIILKLREIVKKEIIYQIKGK